MAITKDRLRRTLGHARAGTLRPFRLATCRRLALPHFVIAGAQKAGTAALLGCLRDHPDVVVLVKEAHYFDSNFHRGENWYRSHFPTASSLRKRGLLTGEATPYYLFHPLAMERLLGSLPEVKIIVMVCDPVERALSHYFHAVRYGNERLPIEAAFEAEKERLANERPRLIAEPRYRSFAYQHHSYVARGMYHDQLAPHAGLIASGQMLVLLSEDFFEDPAPVHARVLAHLGLRFRPLRGNQAANIGVHGEVPVRLRRRLEETFREPNARLAELLGVPALWDRARRAPIAKDESAV